MRDILYRQAYSRHQRCSSIETYACDQHRGTEVERIRNGLYRALFFFSHVLVLPCSKYALNPDCRNMSRLARQERQAPC